VHTNIHHDTVLTKPWIDQGFSVVYQPNCLQIPSQDDGIWDIRFPEVCWSDDTVVIMHCQDFLNIQDGHCRELEIIQNHFGEHCRRVIVVVWNVGIDRIYHGDLHVVYFPTHSYSIIQNLRSATHSWMPQITNDTRDHVFQCLNGATRAHRRRVVNRLRAAANGIVSFGDEIPLASWPYSTYRGTENEDNFSRLLPVYGSCDVNIVTETQYDCFPGIITEKTLFAWLARQVPLIIGYPGIVGDVRSLGFDVFDDVIDLSYDQAPDHARAELAIDLNLRLLQNGIDRRCLMERLNTNQDLALAWPEKLRDDYLAQCHSIGIG